MSKHPSIDGNEPIFLGLILLGLALAYFYSVKWLILSVTVIALLVILG